MTQSVSDSFDGDIDRVADEFEAAWRAGPRPAIRLYLEKVPPSARVGLLHELIEVDWEYRQKSGDPPDADEYPRQLPDLLGARTLAPRNGRRCERASWNE